MLLGSHLSVAGGLANALDEAERLRLDALQIFTKNQRQWLVRPLKDVDRAEWLARLATVRWRTRVPDLPVGRRLVSHNSYLINLASPNSALWKRSVKVQRAEVERCEALGIQFLVSHPGAHLGVAPPTGTRLDLQGEPSRDELAGLRRIVKALDQIHAALPGYQTITCLETTTGSGSCLGYSFGQLRMIREAVREPERVGFCLDTCHVTAAGYDMSSDDAAAAVIEELDAVCGLEHLRTIHLNDSCGALGSRRDRHAHIGQGLCGRACFRALMNQPGLERVPMILETPKGTDDKGINWDSVNLRRLRQLAAGPRRHCRPAIPA
jgi:deoxyribonuclease-4